MMLEWFGHPTQQNHVRASEIVKTRHVLNSLSWVERSYGCDLRNAKAENRMKTVKMLLNSLL